MTSPHTKEECYEFIWYRKLKQRCFKRDSHITLSTLRLIKYTIHSLSFRNMATHLPKRLGACIYLCKTFLTEKL